MVVSGPSAAKVSSPKELAGETIAVTLGTTQDRAVTTSTKDVPDVTIVRYEDDSTTATAILTGQQNYLFAASSVLPVINETDHTRDLEYTYPAVSFPIGVGIRQTQQQLQSNATPWVAETRKTVTLAKRSKHNNYEKTFQQY